MYLQSFLRLYVLLLFHTSRKTLLSATLTWLLIRHAIPLKTPTAVAAWICATAERFDGELEYAAIMLRESCHKLTQSAMMRLEQYSERLHTGVTTALSRQGERLASYAMMAENFAPQRLLRLGFAIARSNNGVIRSTDEVTLGQRITIEVANGSITAEIVEKDESNE